MMTNKRHTLMLLSNGYRPDPRVQREAQGLVDRGYKVTVLCWDRQGEMAARELDQGVEIVRVQDVPTGYGRGWRQMRHFPRFWQKCRAFAADLRPDILHCHDLDTLYAGWRIKRQIGAPLIYDAHEHYPAMMSLYLPGALVKVLAQWERWLLGKTDAVITASTILRDEYTKAGLRDVITLGNYPTLAPFENVNLEEVSAERQKLGVDEETVAFGYVGGFTRNRLFEPFLAAAALRPDVQFHLWGDGPQRPLIDNAAAKSENVTYHGWLAFSRLPVIFKALDIIYYGLRQDYPGAVYNAPNTLAQAMAAARPVIATDVGDLGRTIRENECGVLLNDITPEAIEAALKLLGDVSVRQRLGENGLCAARAKYNAKANQERLASLYDRLEATGPSGMEPYEV